MTALGRNDPCPCGSGKKYKHCCIAQGLQPATLRVGQAHAARGAAALRQGRLELAERELALARTLLPRDAQAWHLSGLLSFQRRQHGTAIEQLQTALSLAPQERTLWSNLANVEEDAGDLAAARRRYEEAARRFPGELEWPLRRLRSLIPDLLQDLDQIEACRAELRAALDALEAQPAAIVRPDLAALVLFGLAYHGRDDKVLAQRLAHLLNARWPALPPGHAAAAPVQAAARDARLRIGFCSDFLHEHSIGKLNQGFITQLDRARFHLTLIHPPHARRDAFQAGLDAAADAVLVLPDDVQAAEAAIAALGLDLLHFPDIGMSPFGYLLASRRMAPVQSTSWGHPVTSGLPAIDHFLSWGLAEPEGADAHYSERLQRLRHPPAWFEPVAATPLTAADAQALERLPSGKRLYGCLQSLFKLHPDFDAVLRAIVERDPDAVIVLIEGERARWTDALRQRLAAQGVAERLLMLPRLSAAGFRALVARMDLLLDTPHFGSGTTVYESFDLGVPSVTWPGAFMRGRLVAAFYRYLDIADAPIALTLDDYADLAVALACDPSRRERLRAQMLAKQAMLYRSRAALGEFEDFCTRAIQAARAKGNPSP